SAQRLAQECAYAGVPSLTRSTLAKIESGVRKSVTTDELVALARALRVPASDLLDSQGDRSQSVDERQDDSEGKEVDGLIFLSIGAPSTRTTFEQQPLLRRALAHAEVLAEYTVEGQVSVDGWADLAAGVRDLAREWAEQPRYARLHLFYRGPVALGPLLGRILATNKPLVVYHQEEGKYYVAYTLGRQFLYSRP